MDYFFAFLVCSFTVGLAWLRFRYAIGLVILALPTYLVRFKFGPLPSTLLEIIFGGVFLVWLIRYTRTDLPIIVRVIRERYWFFIFMTLFFIGSLIGVGVSDMVLLSLGQWRAYFLEPMLLFFVLLGRLKSSSANDGKAKDAGYISVDFLLRSLIFSSLSVALYGIFQWFTGWGIATPEWTAKATRRVTAFFTSPNAVGLYLESLVVATVAYYFRVRAERVDDRAALLPSYEKKRRYLLVGLLIMLGLQLLAIVFTKSDGTVLALGAAFVVSLLLAGYKKTVAGFVVLGIIAAALVPKIQSVILFRDKAGANRLTLWTYSVEFLTASPKNFFAGAGVRQFFRKIQKPHYDVKAMERLIYPHNILFNFWAETGLLGVIGFFGMFAYLVVAAGRVLKKDRAWAIFAIAILTVTLVHGLVDVPYFKNDLAMLWWVLLALFI